MILLKAGFALEMKIPGSISRDESRNFLVRKRQFPSEFRHFFGPKCQFPCEFRPFLGKSININFEAISTLGYQISGQKRWTSIG